MSDPIDPAVSDHLRPTDADASDAPATPGVYRVVGVHESSVALLRVGDADGHRINTGEVTSVSCGELDGFAPAENPDGNRSAAATLASVIESMYWQFRVLARTVAARPLAGGAALAAFALGTFGKDFLPIPEAALTLLIVAGALGLLYLAREGSD